MKFAEAFQLMKDGYKVKLPSWGGYWFWDAEKQTIMMQCRAVDSETGKDLLDIRETHCVEYTIKNILSDEWVEATESNCTLLGGEPTFDFGSAFKYMKDGFKVKRKGWTGNNTYIQIARNISYCSDYGQIENHPLVIIITSGGIQMAWLASQADMLAEDWIFA